MACESDSYRRALERAPREGARHAHGQTLQLSPRTSGGAARSGVHPAVQPVPPRSDLYQGAVIMTHVDRPCGPSGRREAAGDAVHRQSFPTPSDGPHGRPERRLAKAFGQRRARLTMPRIATPHAPCRKLWQTVPMSYYHRSLVLHHRMDPGSGAGVTNEKVVMVRDRNRCNGSVHRLAGIKPRFRASKPRPAPPGPACRGCFWAGCRGRTPASVS